MMSANGSPDNDVYFDRNMLVLLSMSLAKLVGWQTGYVDDVNKPDLRIAIVSTPAGQVSYHLPKDIVNSMHVEKYPGKWDGHTTEENSQRLATAISQLFDPRSLKLLRCQHLMQNPDLPTHNTAFVLSSSTDAECTALIVCETCARVFEVDVMRDVLEAGARDWLNKNHKKFKIGEKP